MQNNRFTCIYHLFDCNHILPIVYLDRKCNTMGHHGRLVDIDCPSNHIYQNSYARVAPFCSNFDIVYLTGQWHKFHLKYLLTLVNSCKTIISRFRSININCRNEGFLASTIYYKNHIFKVIIQSYLLCFQVNTTTRVSTI